MHPPFRTVLFGHGVVGLRLAQALFDNPTVDVVAIYPWCDHPGSKFPEFHAEQDAPLKAWAKVQGIPLLSGWQANDPDCITWMTEHQVAWVQLGCWGEILKPPFLTLPNLLITNCHPGLLPEHRGPNPYASAIRVGDSHSGVTFHRVDAGIDTSPILHREVFAMDPRETGDTLQYKAADAASKGVHAVVSLLQQPTLAEVPQHDNEGVYYPNIVLEDGIIQWMADPHAVERNARALRPWVSSIAFWNGNTAVLSQDLELVAHTPTDEEAIRPPGIVHCTTADMCQITSAEPQWLYQLSDYIIVVGNLQVPRHISGMLGAWLLQPDKGTFWHTPMIHKPYISGLTPDEVAYYEAQANGTATA
jgi:methionyl-tRNA formyltransferase